MVPVPLLVEVLDASPVELVLVLVEPLPEPPVETPVPISENDEAPVRMLLQHPSREKSLEGRGLPGLGLSPSS